MKKLMAMILCMIIASYSLTGCSTTKNSVDINKIIKPTEASTSLGKLDKKPKNQNETFDFIIWNNTSQDKYIENAVISKYPHANLKIVKYEAADSEKVIKALASNEPIDMITYNREGFGNFNCIDGLEDLLQPEYDFDSIKSIFSERELKQCMSFDDNKLLALPFPEYPLVTYYRTDILEKHGIPTDPEELAKLMSTVEGWLSIANKLIKDNIYIIQWQEELLQKALRSYAFYDEDMNLIINNEKVRESLKLTKEVSKSGLSSRYNIWIEEGRKAIKEGKIAMIYVNKWGEGTLNSFVPEQAGKWRATRLPLNMYGYQDSNYASIVSSSKHKAEAWEILKRYMVNEYSYVADKRNDKSEFLGGQKSMLLYEDLINKMPSRNPTILDDKDYSIFFDVLYNNIDTCSSEEILNLAISKINEQTYHDQRVLIQYLNEKKQKQKNEEQIN